MPEVPSHEICIRYDDHGWGEPTLLFMPGWYRSRRVFDELARRCGRRKRLFMS